MNDREWVYHGDTIDTALAAQMARGLLSHGCEVLIRIEDLSPLDTGQIMKNYTVWERDRSGTRIRD